MRAGGADTQSLVTGDSADVGADPAQLVRDLGRGVAHRRGDLEYRLHQLGVDDRLELVPDNSSEHGVDVLHEVEALAVQQHVLLLDPQRVGIALAESMVEDAASFCEARTFPRDRRGIYLLPVHHSGRSASTSISTS